MKVTIIGTLPPLKGIPPYCFELLRSLSKHIDAKAITGGNNVQVEEN